MADEVALGVHFQAAAAHQVVIAVADLVVTDGIRFSALPVQYPHLYSTALGHRNDLQASLFDSAIGRAPQFKAWQVQRALGMPAATGLLCAGLHDTMALCSVAIRLLIRSLAVAGHGGYFQQFAARRPDKVLSRLKLLLLPAGGEQCVHIGWTWRQRTQHRPVAAARDCEAGSVVVAGGGGAVPYLRQITARVAGVGADVSDEGAVV
ncbi:hypothetical protein D3C85_814400 [compost metagenome]